MSKFNIGILCTLLSLAACKKDDASVALPNGSISFQYTATKDTIELPISILKDSAIVLGLKAALSGTTSTSEHQVIFGIDSTKMLDYRARFGAATLLPQTSYLFYKSIARIAPGTSVSDSAQLNIGLQTKLTEYSTYVLPVVIKSVDGKVEGVATSRVLYYVFKTGKPLFVNKLGWAIADSSSANGSAIARNVLDDNNLTTSWTTNITQQMPQWVTINFNKTITFIGLNYYLPTASAYPKNGGYPTRVRIETSMDGTNWVSKGEFAGNITLVGTQALQTINLGAEVTARYLRFTSLAAVKLISGANSYDAISISGIALIP